jgi:hypothetical protein
VQDIISGFASVFNTAWAAIDNMQAGVLKTTIIVMIGLFFFVPPLTTIVIGIFDHD